MSESAQRNFIRRKFKLIVRDVTREKLVDPELNLTSDPVSINFKGIVTKWEVSLSQCVKDGTKFLGAAVHLLNYDYGLFFYDFIISLQDAKIEKNYCPRFLDHDICPLVELEKLLDSSKSYLQEDSQLEFIIDIKLRLRLIKSKDVKRIYSHLYDQPTFADFTLIPFDDEEKEFKVHRTILAYESEFFMKLFTTDMKEKQNGSVKFDDIDSTTLEEVIKYIYKGEADFEDTGKASDILYAAEKFNLPGLKLMCIEFLDKKVCTGNALEILAIAELFKSQFLEHTCLDMIVENFNVMKETEGWKTITTPMLMKITDALNSAYITNIPHLTSILLPQENHRRDDNDSDRSADSWFNSND